MKTQVETMKTMLKEVHGRGLRWMGKICGLQMRMDGEYLIVCRKEKCSCMKKKGQHWKPMAKE